MANGLSTLWQGVVSELDANKASLGLDNIERAQTGKVVTLPAPAAAVWIQPEIPKLTSQNGAVLFPCDVFVFCIAGATTTEAEALDAALEIAKNVLLHLTNRVIGNVVLEQPNDEEPLTVVENSSIQAIVGVLLKAEVVL